MKASYVLRRSFCRCRGVRPCWGLALLAIQVGLAASCTAQETGRRGTQVAVDTSAALAHSYRVAGTVTDARSGEPVARATVSIVDELERNPVKSTETGSDGQFALDHVAAGKYGLMVARRGYMTSYWNEHELFSSAIVAGEGLDTEHIDFKLSPGAMLRGTITDDAGEPIAQAQITLMRKTREGGIGERLERAIQGNTDDTGGFEFWDLRPGTYFLAVKAMPWYALHPSRAQRAKAENSEAMAALDVAYPVTYYDGTAEEAAAAPIVLASGDRAEADMALHAVPAIHMVVRAPEVATRDGRQYVDTPMLRQSVLGQEEYVPATQMQPGPPGSGWVELGGIAPGHYEVLQGNPQHVVDVNAGSSGDVDVDVTAGVPTVHVTVKMVMTDGSEPPAPINLTLVPVDMMSRGIQGQRQGRDGYQFASVPPGSYTVQASMGGSVLAVVATQSAEGAHRDAKVEVKERSLTLTAWIAKSASSIRGFARKDGKGLAGAMIVLVPESGIGNLALYRRDQSDSDGSFLLADVVPGRYTVVAIEEGWALDWARPEVMKRFLPLGESVTVSGTSEKVVHLPEAVKVQER